MGSFLKGPVVPSRPELVDVVSEQAWRDWEPCSYPSYTLGPVGGPASIAACFPRPRTSLSTSHPKFKKSTSGSSACASKVDFTDFPWKEKNATYFLKVTCHVVKCHETSPLVMLFFSLGFRPVYLSLDLSLSPSLPTEPQKITIIGRGFSALCFYKHLLALFKANKRPCHLLKLDQLLPLKPVPGASVHRAHEGQGHRAVQVMNT